MREADCCVACSDLLTRHGVVHGQKHQDVPITGLTRTPIACLSCATSKTKCDKAWPCGRCTSRNLQCLLKPSRRGLKMNAFTQREAKQLANIAKQQQQQNTKPPRKIAPAERPITRSAAASGAAPPRVPSPCISPYGPPSSQQPPVKPSQQPPVKSSQQPPVNPPHQPPVEPSHQPQRCCSHVCKSPSAGPQSVASSTASSASDRTPSQDRESAPASSNTDRASTEEYVSPYSVISPTGSEIIARPDTTSEQLGPSSSQWPASTYDSWSQPPPATLNFTPHWQDPALPSASTSGLDKSQTRWAPQQIDPASDLGGLLMAPESWMDLDATVPSADFTFADTSFFPSADFEWCL